MLCTLVDRKLPVARRTLSERFSLTALPKGKFKPSTGFHVDVWHQDLKLCRPYESLLALYRRYVTVFVNPKGTTNNASPGAIPHA